MFDDLEIPRLSRVNVVAGGNNAGKTSLLKALFLLSGGGNPHFALNASITRTANDIETRSDARITGDSVRATLWKPLFFGFDFDRTIEVTAHHQPCGSLSLTAALEPRTSSALPLEDAGRADQGLFDQQLTLRFQQGNASAIRAAIQLSAKDIHLKHHHETIPFAVLIDEVENGIHHSALTDHQAIQTDDLAVHRLEVDEGRCGCVTYERSVIAAAFRHNIEVR